jgi:hypothetical protein
MDSKRIRGISHPIPTEYAERIYNEGKTVFVSKKHLGKVSSGDKFVVYESHGVKGYTGWADIKSIGLQDSKTIAQKYGKKLVLSTKEFNEYSKGKKKMNIIEFENFEKFKKPVKPTSFMKLGTEKIYFVTVAGKYIFEDEYQIIKKNKD